MVDDIKVSTVGKAIQAYRRLIAKTAPLNYSLPKKKLARICIGLFLDKLYWLKGGDKFFEFELWMSCKYTNPFVHRYLRI